MLAYLHAWPGFDPAKGDRRSFIKTVVNTKALMLVRDAERQKRWTGARAVSLSTPMGDGDDPGTLADIIDHAGLDADQSLDMHRFDHLLPLAKAIIKHENGRQPYTDAQLTKALVLAGVEPAKSSLQQTRTVKGGQAATAATAGLGVVEVVQQTIDPARDALMGLTPYLEVAKWLLLAVTLIGIGVMLWARIDDHRKGLR